MATIEFIRYTPFRYDGQGSAGLRSIDDKVIERLPQLVWRNHVAWAEANIWALEQAKAKDIKTVHSAMGHLLGYANWLEEENLDWWHFPARRTERCLPRFRGALIAARNRGDIAPSTASARMSTVIRFYRWLQEMKLLSPDVPMWTDRQVGVRLKDGFGFEHMMQVVSTDLSIKNTKVGGAIELEDGVTPLTSSGASEVLAFAALNASEELTLMLQLGFGTGLRLGSIVDLKLETLERAALDPISGCYTLSIGPAAKPPVATKFGNSGNVPIPVFLLDTLRAYSLSTRRLKRQSIAARELSGLLFLTRFGKPAEDTTSIDQDVRFGSEADHIVNRLQSINYSSEFLGCRDRVA